MNDWDFIQELIEKIDIVEVVERYVKLKKVGKNYAGLCPFHPETKPSFFVSPDKKLFHCFGCKKSGNVITFIKEIEHLSFWEAVEKLAKEYNIEIPKLKREAKEISKEKKILGRTAEIYHKILFTERGKEAFRYLKEEREIDNLIIQRFKLGYSPRDGMFLVEKMVKEGYSMEDLIDLGLCVRRESGAVVDFFRGRLMFPIEDERGEVVGFGGRVLGEGEPKYLNTKETDFFKKSKLFYGLSKAKEEIRKKDEVFIVEGYFDVIRMHQIGVKNVVAPLGTALTKDHAHIISKYTSRVVLLFDGDEAGLKAIKRSLPFLLEKQISAEIILLPEGEDPDTFFRKKDNISILFENRMDIIDFYTEKFKDIEGVREVCFLISLLEDEILKAKLVEKLSQKTNIPYNKIEREVEKFEGNKPGSFLGTILKEISTNLPKETKLIAYLLQSELKDKFVEEDISPEDFLYIESKRIFEFFKKGGNLNQVMEEDKKIAEILTETAIEFSEKNISPEIAYKELMKIIYKNRIKNLSKEIEKFDLNGEREKSRELLSKIMEYKRMLLNLNEEGRT